MLFYRYVSLADSNECLCKEEVATFNKYFGDGLIEFFKEFEQKDGYL
jgi:hypothetical protein